MFPRPARKFCSVLRIAAVSLPCLLAGGFSIPAHAQAGASVSFDGFHDRLAARGTWSNNARWGAVWQPNGAGSDFRPYSNGHWADTSEYGYLWVSGDPWGDVTDHYGRWVMDPTQGWLWVPGYVWAPAWVVWRSGGGNIGWLPMPPGGDFTGDGTYSGDFDADYGYSGWYGASFGADQFQAMWTFVPEDHFRDQNYRNYVVPQRSYGNFFAKTRDNTHYTVANGFVVNRSIDDRALERDTHQTFHPVAARTVIGHDALITQRSAGIVVERREAAQHPVASAIKKSAPVHHPVSTNERRSAGVEPRVDSGEGAGSIRAETKAPAHKAAAPSGPVPEVQPAHREDAPKAEAPRTEPHHAEANTETRPAVRAPEARVPEARAPEVARAAPVSHPAPQARSPSAARAPAANNDGKKPDENDQK